MKGNTELKDFLFKKGANLNWEVNNTRRGLVVSRWRLGNNAIIIMENYSKGYVKLGINGDILLQDHKMSNFTFIINTHCYLN